MKKSTLSIILIAMAVFFNSCTEQVNPEATWTLLSLDNGITELKTEDGTLNSTITLSIVRQSETEEYGVSGFAGVNHFNGTVSIENNTLTVNPLAVTMMMGADEAQKIEDNFIKVLQNGGKLSVKESDGKTVLTLKNNTEKTELVFKQTLLENTAWNLSMFNVGNAVTNVPQGMEGVSLAFSEDGKIFGSTGVNNIMGSYEFSEEGALLFSSVATTRMAAPNKDASDFEIALIQLLGQVTTFDISGQTLTLRNANGESLLVYVK